VHLYTNIKKGMKRRAFTERVVLAVALLSLFAVFPMLFARTIEKNWYMVALDIGLLFMFFIIALNVLNRRRLELSRCVLGGVMVFGMIGTSVLGQNLSIYWLYPGFIALFFMFTPKVAIWMTLFVCLMVFPSLFVSLDAIELFKLYATLMPTIVFIYYFSKEMRSQHAELNSLVSVDYLTQAGNRRAFNKAAESCISQENRKKLKSALIVFDMDHFKQLNDRHGHGIGDAVLKDVTRIVSHCIRKSDQVFRLGGEEFAIVVPNSNQNDALAIAEKIRASIHQLRDEDLPRFTVSFGLTELTENDTVASWMERADQALYSSKENGRNQISAA
jgi:diguanylate cyclase (GGDEF)-like protein